MTAFPPSMTWPWKGLSLLCFLVISAHIVILRLHSGSFNHDSRFSLEAYFEKTVYKPFAFRFFIPTLAQGIEEALPSSLHHKLSQAKLLKIFSVEFAGSEKYGIRLTAVFFLNFLFVFFALFYFQKLLSALYACSEPFAFACTIAFAYTIPFFFHERAYFYDLPALSFGILTLFCIVRNNFLGMLGLLLLGFMNKETHGLYLLVWFLYHFRSQTWKTTTLQGASLLAMFVLLRGIIISSVAKSPGTSMEYHIPYNFSLFAVDPWYYNFQFLAFLLFLASVGKSLAEKPKILKDAASIPLVLLVAYLFGGIWEEYRVFLEAWPIVFLLALPSISELIFRFPIPTQTPALGISGASLLFKLLPSLALKRALLFFLLLLCILSYGAAVISRSFFVAQSKAEIYKSSLPFTKLANELPKNGLSWFDDRVIKFFDSGITVTFGGRYAAKVLTISLDKNDIYEVCFLNTRRSKPTLCRIVGPSLDDDEKGMIPYVISLGKPVSFSAVSIRPLAGDGRYGLASMRLDKSYIRQTKKPS